MASIIAKVGDLSPESDDALAAAAKQVGARIEPIAPTKPDANISDRTQLIALVVDPQKQSSVFTALSLRQATKGVPILGLSRDRQDREFLEHFALGGDDLVDRNASAMAERFRLLTAARGATLTGHDTSGFAVVVSSDARWSAQVIQAFTRGGYEAQHVSSLAALDPVLGSRRVSFVTVGADIAPSELGPRVSQTSGDELPWLVVATASNMADGTFSNEHRVRLIDASTPVDTLLYVGNELVFPPLANSRKSPRLLYGTRAEFVRSLVRGSSSASNDVDVGYIYNVSLGGLYVRTLAPPPVGESVSLVFIPPAARKAVNLKGVVSWRRLYGARQTASIPAGFGVRLETTEAGDLDQYNAGCAALAREMMPHGL